MLKNSTPTSGLTKIELWDPDATSLIQVMSSGNIDPRSLVWPNDAPLLPIPTLPTFGTPLHYKLNARWNVLLDRRQWNFKFRKLWDKQMLPKKAYHVVLVVKFEKSWMCGNCILVIEGVNRNSTTKQSKVVFLSVFFIKQCKQSRIIYHILS